MSQAPGTFREFFDPRNLSHLEAYRKVCQDGCWPKGFIPEEMDMLNWQIFAMSALADAYMEDFAKKIGEQH